MKKPEFPQLKINLFDGELRGAGFSKLLMKLLYPQSFGIWIEIAFNHQQNRQVKSCKNLIHHQTSSL